jgi:DNA-binding NarL/FixJ family response regulator
MVCERTAAGYAAVFLCAGGATGRGVCDTPRMGKRILLVGHCGVDGPRLKDELSRALPGTEVERVNSDGDLRRTVGDGEALLLVNREPVGFDEEGLDIIRKLKAEHPDCKVMLVSDRADAQREAERAGALAGFGKSEMGSPQLAEHVKRALG